MPDTTRPEARTKGREDGRSLYSVAQIQHVLRVEFTRAQRYRYPIVANNIEMHSPSPSTRFSTRLRRDRRNNIRHREGICSA